MNKKITYIALASLLAIGVVVVAGSGVVEAFGKNGFNNSQISSEIAKRFNLNQTDVQKFFDEKREQNQAQMQQKFNDRIAQLVKDNKLTQTQANLIIAKHVEIQKQHQDLMTNSSGKTPEQIKEAFKAQQDSLKQWAQDNNIPLGYIMMGGNGQKGGMRGGMGANCPFAK